MIKKIGSSGFLFPVSTGKTLLKSPRAFGEAVSAECGVRVFWEPCNSEAETAGRTCTGFGGHSETVSVGSEKRSNGRVKCDTSSRIQGSHQRSSMFCVMVPTDEGSFSSFFITHCGWNSVVESIANGVSMLCWPYFADQFLNCVYVVEVWRTGLAFNIVDSDGVIRNGEVEKAVGMVVEDDKMKRRVMKLSEEARDAVKGETRSSYVNFESFAKVMEDEVCVIY